MACREDLEQAAIYDMEFHALLAHATENPLIIQTYTVFREVFNKSMHAVIQITGGCGADIFHAKIIEAVEKRDVEQAREAMRQHIVDTQKYILQ